MNTPTIEQIKALDGKVLTTLTDNELSVLNFYRDRGRKFRVAVSVINEADPTSWRARPRASRPTKF
ncbi:hypothetical protein [Burkholderia gladioli]|uniref:hypothetical protein n=1 Tax=Burkholderia gladioli TaxID=28095 RepID=UPI00163FE8ED|nr:hypothetical protein [Burkholderia gladioli]